MNVFNDSIMYDSKKVAPLIISDLAKVDPQLQKIKDKLTPNTIIAQGFFKNLVSHNMTQAGVNKASDAITSRVVNGIIPTVSDEIDEVVKLFQPTGMVTRNESVPKDYFRIRCLGHDKSDIPEYVGVSAFVPYELNLKELMRQEGFTENDVKNHFNDVKGYWTLVNSGGNASGLVELCNKINEKEDEFFHKICDYTTVMAGKTLTRSFGVDAFVMTSKGCKNIGYFPDPWISVFVRTDLLRLKDNNPNWSVRFNLTSWESGDGFKGCTAKYYMEVTLYYKCKGKIFGGCTFERNGITY